MTFREMMCESRWMHYICSYQARKRELTRQNIILLILVGLLSSCFDDGDCTTTKTDVILVNFKKLETKKDTIINIQSITLTGSDSVFNVMDTTSSIALPLDPNVTSLKINFVIDTDQHELSVEYMTTPRLISPDCGVELSFTDIVVNNHDFDSVAVLSSFLDQQTSPNIVIYQ